MHIVVHTHQDWSTSPSEMPFSQSCYGDRLCNFHCGIYELQRILILFGSKHTWCRLSEHSVWFMVYGLINKRIDTRCGKRRTAIVSMEMFDMLLNKTIQVVAEIHRDCVISAWTVEQQQSATVTFTNSYVQSDVEWKVISSQQIFALTSCFCHLQLFVH